MVFPPAPSPSSLLATLLNHLLRRQAWAQAVLRPHAGKSVRVQGAAGKEAGRAGWALALRVQADGRVAPWGASAPADVVLTLKHTAQHDPLAALREAVRSRAAVTANDVSWLAEQVHIEGEAALAQAVLTLAQTLRWDPEDELALWLGDRAAVTVSGVLKEAGQGVRQAALHLTENLAEYVTHENPLLLARVPFEDWAAQVQGLAQRLDRLEHALEHALAGCGATTLPRTPPAAPVLPIGPPPC